MKYFIFILIVFYSCSITKTDKSMIFDYEEIYSFTSFPKKGSTSSILHRLNNEEYKKEKLQSNNLEQINKLFKSVQGTKHHQKKIGSVIKAFEMKNDNKSNIFIIYDNKLINLSRLIEYELNNENYELLINLQ